MRSLRHRYAQSLEIVPSASGPVLKLRRTEALAPEGIVDLIGHAPTKSVGNGRVAGSGASVVVIAASVDEACYAAVGPHITEAFSVMPLVRHVNS